MAATIAQVRAILPAWTADPIITDDQIQAAIDAAACALERVSVCMSQLSAVCQDIVCAYLAAHFVAVTHNSLSLVSETDPCSGGKQTFGFKFGEGIKGTPYGQAANTISGGCVAELDKMPVRFVAIGSIGDC